MSNKRRRGTLGKVLAVFAVLATALVLGLGATPGVASAQGEANLGVPAHEKTATKNEDGTYTVTLSVTGATDSSSETISKPVDIVLVVDQSTSMNEGDRMTNVRNAAKQLAESVLADNGDGQVRISVVLFGTYTQDKQGNPKVGGSGWLTSASAVVNEIPTYAPNDQTGIFANGNGTNWEAGLRDASNILQTARSEAEKYVIFLSDGEPTYRLEDAGDDTGMFESWAGRFFDRTTGERVYWIPGLFSEGHFSTSPIDIGGRDVDTANVEYVEGTGNTNPNQVNSDAALEVAKQISQNATFFSVSAESGTDWLMSSFHQRVTGSTDGFYSAGDAGSLNEAFNDISSIIRSEASYRNVTITDTLSQWVTGVSTDGSATADGRVEPSTFTYSKNGEAWSDAPRATVGEDGTITWALGENLTLEDDVTYSMSFVVALNQAAYDDAASKGQTTSYPTNGEASISYDVYKTVNGQPSGEPEHGTGTYESPSVEVPVSTLTITKVWDGDGVKPESVVFDVYQDDEKYGDPVTLTDDGSGNWTGQVVVAAGPEGHTYSLSEVNPGDGWTVGSITANDTDEQKVTLTGLTAQTATFTVTNVPESYALWVYKTDADTGEPLHNAKFDLYAAADDGTFVKSAENLIGQGVVGTEAEDDHAVFEGLQPGTYYLMETHVPAGYQLKDEPYKIVVSSSGIQFASTPDGEMASASKVDGQDRTYQVSFKNVKAADGEIPSTGGAGNLPLYVTGIVAIAGSVMAVRKVRRS